MVHLHRLLLPLHTQVKCAPQALCEFHAHLRHGEWGGQLFSDTTQYRRRINVNEMVNKTFCLETLSNVVLYCEQNDAPIRDRRSYSRPNYSRLQR